MYLNSYVTDIKSDLTTLNCISTHFKATDFNNRYTQANTIAGRTYTITLTFDLDKFTTIEEAKAWLAEQYANNNAVIIEYESTEETIEAYTEEQQTVYNKLQKLLLYKHYNSIACTDEVSCKMKLSYTAEEATIVQNQGLEQSKPKFKLFGSGEGEVYINDLQAFKINIDDEYVIVDVKEEEAYKGNILKNRNMLGDFENIVLKPRSKFYNLEWRY